jgi:hypothetical protein
MKQSDDIQRMMQEALNHYKGPVTQKVLNEIATRVMIEANSKPVPDAEGLSPVQLKDLLYDLFGSHSLVKLNRNVNLDGKLPSPLLNLCLHYLEIVQKEKEVKLTKTGALPVKIVLELAGSGYITLKYHGIPLPVRVEKDYDPLVMVKFLSGKMGLTKVRNGKLSLTARGLSQMSHRPELLADLTAALFTQMSWGYFDRYESEQAGQFGAGFTLVLLKNYGDQEREAEFYAHRFAKAFPAVLNEFSPSFMRSGQDVFSDCYEMRTFERSLNWLGLVETRETGSFREMNIRLWVKTTPLFYELVRIEY